MMKNNVTSIIFYGIGGQGVLTAAEICALAAMYDGFAVKKSEVHGMAQRGGSVESHVRFGDIVYSPITPYAQADYLICCHNAEYGRFKGYLKKTGTDLFEFLNKGLLIVPKKIFINIYLIGVLSVYTEISEQSWIRAIKQTIKSQFVEDNIKWFYEGRKGIV
ncbi:MAG: 2-oxoacid:acceptor oxidoreductase family protein [Candidatus Omnitrophica bacterium]|nr:2-oxoacid:acceptor oxidoreductase family protein [Candidatus Omnitrophota bacterium]